MKQKWRLKFACLAVGMTFSWLIPFGIGAGVATGCAGTGLGLTALGGLGQSWAAPEVVYTGEQFQTQTGPGTQSQSQTAEVRP